MTVIYLFFSLIVKTTGRKI